jgi:hypothetical protein
LRVVKRSGRGYAQDPTKFLNFSRFAEQGATDVSLVEGAFEQSAGWEQFGLSANELARIRKTKVIRLEFEEPNKFFLGDDQDTYDADFHRVFTICPHTAKWLNERQGFERRAPVCFPFNEDYIPAPQEKRYDVIYTGHIVAKAVLRDIEVLRGFNYRFVSNSPHPFVTNQGASYEEKMALIAQSRVTLVNNLLYPRLYHLVNIWRYRGWRTHGAFTQLPGPTGVLRFFTQRSKMIVPQLKSRVFEAAFGRSLILCRRDPFNVIENFFEPEREFVYYDEGGLKEAIARVLASYPRFEEVAQRAFERATREYTTEAFFKRHVKNLR